MNSPQSTQERSQDTIARLQHSLQQLVADITLGPMLAVRRESYQCAAHCCGSQATASNGSTGSGSSSQTGRRSWWGGKRDDQSSGGDDVESDNAHVMMMTNSIAPRSVEGLERCVVGCQQKLQMAELAMQKELTGFQNRLEVRSVCVFISVYVYILYLSRRRRRKEETKSHEVAD